MTKRQPDAIAFLEAHRRQLEALFARYDALASSRSRASERKRLADETCLELTMRARLAQELVHPAARTALDDQDGLVDDSEAAYEGLRESISRLLAMRADDPLLDACMALLRQRASAQLRDECETLLPWLREACPDLAPLSRALSVRMEELHAVADALREDALVASLAA